MKAGGDRRTLVTGASGYLGGHLLAALRKESGGEIVLAGRSRPAAHGDLPFHEADLVAPGEGARLIETVAPTDLLCLAWCATPGMFWTDPLNEAWRDSTRETIEAFAQAGGRHVTVAGSCAEYDWTAGALLSEENTPCRPATLYGQCKDGLRRWLQEFAAERGLGWAWGRVFWTFGPGEPEEKLVAQVIARLLRGEPALLGPGTAVRDYLHAADIGTAFSRLSTERAQGVYNIGSGAGTQVASLAKAVAEAVGREDLLRLGARPAAASEAPELVADTVRLRGLGWAPRLPLAEALRETVAWYRARLSP